MSDLPAIVGGAATDIPSSQRVIRTFLETVSLKRCGSDAGFCAEHEDDEIVSIIYRFMEAAREGTATPACA